MANNNYVSQSSFTLGDEVLRKLRKSAFIRGGNISEEETRAAIEASLAAGQREASAQAALAQDARFRQNQLDLQARDIAFRNQLSRDRFDLEKELEKKRRRQQLFAGLGSLAGTALFSPLNISTNSKSGATTFQTGAGAIISGIKSLFP